MTCCAGSAGAYFGQGLWARAAQVGQLGLILLVVVATLVAAVLAYGWLRSTAVDLDRTDAWLVRAPLGLHAGWLTLATILTTTDSLLAQGTEGLGLGADTWSVLLLIAAGAITAAVTLRAPGSLAFPAAAAWGLAATTVAQFPVNLYIGITAATMALLVIVAATRWAHLAMGVVSGARSLPGFSV